MTSIANGLYIGQMSGTSMDGVDTVLARFTADGPQVLGRHYLPYTKDLKNELIQLLHPGLDELNRSHHLSVQLARHYAEGVLSLLKATQTLAENIVAIGSHGQTLRHAPESGYSIQINHPSQLAELTHIAVIADFRNRDIAANGQGAPLVPAFHQAVFAHPERHRLILNLGGIANVTRLSPGIPVIGFDTGPANMLLDSWIRHIQGFDFDAEGAWASSGKVIPALLSRLIRESTYLPTPPPKSCGAEQFNLPWLLDQLHEHEAPEDVQATLMAFTVNSISSAIQLWCKETEEIYVCGGGARNTAMMRALKKKLPGLSIQTTEAIGVAIEDVEALAFAWLARQHCLNIPGNLPEVTGATGPRVLGARYPA